MSKKKQISDKEKLRRKNQSLESRGLHYPFIAKAKGKGIRGGYVLDDNFNF